MNKDFLYGAAAYILWGFFPLYFKTLSEVSSVQIVGHRIVWSFVLLLVIVFIRGEYKELRARLNGRTLLVYLAAGLLLAVNWMTFVWGVNSGLVLEASLGYFINPLVNVLLGVVFLREKLRLAQWIPIGLAAGGVLYMTINYGALPWLSLELAITFGLYGLVKKLAPLNSLQGLTLETGMVFLPALGYLLFVEFQGTGAFIHMGLLPSVLMALTGVVTAIPLLLFANSARTVSLSTLGLLQYVSPTLQFILGVFVFGESFTTSRIIGFCIIWLALILFTGETYFHHRQEQQMVEG